LTVDPGLSTVRSVSRLLVDTIDRHRSGDPVGITSVCSAHPLVLEAAVRQAVEDGTYVLVEATSNQVDQDGGYTGLRPVDFHALVHGIAQQHGLPAERVVLGGDHLGPNVWRRLGPDEAMRRAEVLVAAYVTAGFTKIHLDCSMSCAGDPPRLSDEVVAERAARLARVAQDVAPQGGDLVYVVGTEVPVPGGAHETIDTLTPTSAEAARLTLETHRTAFERAGAAAAWRQVIGLVVQPGVEFDHVKVVDYDRAGTRQLRGLVAEQERIVFEAHSTDYQTRGALRELVEDHWAILKVGPGLTFALREALFALAAIEDQLLTSGTSGLVGVVDARMAADPTWWQGYYEGDEQEQRLARRYSFSDRVRYYWPDPQIRAAVQRLFANLTQHPIPLPLLSAYLPAQYQRVRTGAIAADPHSIVVDRVRDVLRDYACACAGRDDHA
jgi:D-tagatose-1,6-bisphosphate aldolase subunit GatZ/KbaZ